MIRRLFPYKTKLSLLLEIL